MTQIDYSLLGCKKENLAITWLRKHHKDPDTGEGFSEYWENFDKTEEQKEALRKGRINFQALQKETERKKQEIYDNASDEGKALLREMDEITERGIEAMDMPGWLPDDWHCDVFPKFKTPESILAWLKYQTLPLKPENAPNWIKKYSDVSGDERIPGFDENNTPGIDAYDVVCDAAILISTLREFGVGELPNPKLAKEVDCKIKRVKFPPDIALVILERAAKAVNRHSVCGNPPDSVEIALEEHLAGGAVGSDDENHEKPDGYLGLDVCPKSKTIKRPDVSEVELDYSKKDNPWSIFKPLYKSKSHGVDSPGPAHIKSFVW